VLCWYILKRADASEREAFIVKRQTGFNLIEVMVVVAIIGLVTSMGWKVFTEQGRINNRTDAIQATTAVALALTKFETDVGSFIWTPGALALNTVSAHYRYLPQVNVGTALSTPNSNVDITCAERRGFRWSVANGQYESCRGFYSIAVVVTPAPPAVGTAYTITTTAIPGLPQANDLECNQFTLDSNGQKGHLAIDKSAGVGPVTDQGTAANIDGQFHSTKRCWGSD